MPPDKPMQPHSHHPAPRSAGSPNMARGSVDRSIRAFLAGETHGEDLLKRLYGDVVNEPIPERLRALLRG